MTLSSRELLSGRVLITGASGGLGRAMAQAFAERGATLILTGRRAEVLEQMAAEFGGQAIVCDLADREAVEQLIGEMGEVDVLVANAGIPGAGALPDLTRDQIDEALEVNLRSQIALAHAAAERMVLRRRGHIVMMSSMAAKAIGGNASIYTTTKYALRGFALAIREDLRPYDVGVSVVMPGLISDAGMLVDAGIPLPPGVGTRTSHEAAAGVIRAIEENRAEVEVAPLKMRAGLALTSLAPQFVSSMNRRRGGGAAAAAASAAADAHPSDQGPSGDH